MNPLVNKQTAQSTQMARPNQMPNPMQFMGQFMQNPIGALRQAGYNIPDGLNDPRQIVNHLINNGQLNNSRLSQLQNMARMFSKR